MRHSIAVPADFQTTDDSRSLTSRGRQLAQVAGIALAAMLEERGLQLDCIVTSPLVRAVQTAELVAGQLGHEDEIRAMACLRSESPSQRGVEELQALGHGVTLAVSHEPLVSAMNSLLQGAPPAAVGPGFHPSEVRVFEDGAVVWRHQP